MLSTVDFQNPLLWAVLIGWIMSVVLHEFAHGLVAWMGGDYTIRERGGLTLNPLQYIDPLMSIILPAVFLLMGGVPLPGGSTYIRRDLLRNKFWESAVSLAGPAMNFLIFLILCAFLHPRFGWINQMVPMNDWSTAQKFVAGMAFLQLYAVLLNLIPVPPLDGFQMIAPYLPVDLRVRLSTPPWSSMLFFAYFLVIMNSQDLQIAILRVMFRVMGALGVNPFLTYEAFLELFRKQ
jgi:Zn-dependent protease